MNYDAVKTSTAEHFANPMPGDRFSEMFSFWVVVLYVTQEGGVMTMEWSGHGSYWNEGEAVFHESLDAFAKAFAYGSIEGYTVLYDDNVSHTKEFAEALSEVGQV